MTCENSKRLDERVPYLLDLDLKYRGITIALMLEDMNIEPYLSTGKISAVSVGGESAKHGRPLNYDWVISIREQCKRYKVNFIFHQTGTHFIRNKNLYYIPMNKEREQAAKAGLNLIFKKGDD